MKTRDATSLRNLTENTKRIIMDAAYVAREQYKKDAGQVGLDDALRENFEAQAKSMEELIEVLE